MHRVAFLAACLSVVLALSGCSGDGGGGDDDGPAGGAASAGGDPSQGGPGSGPGAGPGPGAGSSGNHAPTARLEVVVPTSGGAVEFTVDGQDSDGDELTWSLDFGDGTPNFGGSALPAEVNHTYEEGSYEANLTVSDGMATTHAMVTVGVAAAAAIQSVDGTYVAGFEGCAAAAYDQAGVDAGGAAGGTTNGLTRVQFVVEPATVGLPYTAVFSFDQGYLYVSVDFFSSGGTLVSSDNTGQSPNFGGVTIDGVVPDGAATAVLFACGGPTSASVHYEA